mmetsp:Transcript_2961/g.5972  ORF Transcript_2961/g.5972 Transcript_2961/m.5972 type:complete len:122 (-) Transcript_2961:206-571(-)
MLRGCRLLERQKKRKFPHCDRLFITAIIPCLTSARSFERKWLTAFFSLDHTSDDRAAIVGSVRDIWILPLSCHVVIFLVNGGGFTYHQNLVAMLPFALAKLELEEKMLAAVISHILSKEAI